MAIKDWLNIRSNKQIKKDNIDFEKSIFPYGEEEKQNVIDVLNQFHIKNIKTTTLLFDFITLKQALFLSPESDKEYDIWYYSGNVNILTREEKIKMKAFVILENEIKGLNDFPTLESIENKAMDLKDDPIPEKRHNKIFNF